MKANTFFPLLLLISGFAFFSGCQGRPLYKENRILMGTFVDVSSTNKDAPEIAFREIARIEALLSKYIDTSEISRLNKTGYLKASPETFYIIKRSKEFWSSSAGAFDISVGPLLDLWGFSAKNYYVPTEEEIRAALQKVGSDKIILDEKNFVVQFKVPGMKLDLGAIAKGYAVDCAVAKLKENGITSGLVNAGGNIYGLGDKAGKPWTIGIRDPKDRAKASGYLYLRDNAVATSGNYEQFFIRNGRRYCHILNPKTGHPVDSDMEAVTVIAPDALTADALSTSVFVLGKGKGRALAKKFSGVEIRIAE